MAKFNLSQLMNEKSKSEAEPEKKAFHIELLPIGKLFPSRMNKYTVADVSELKASIEMMGLQQNLLVRERDDGTYEIISGHRRFKAMQELVSEGNTAFSDVPCKVIRSGDDITAELQLLFANSTARQMTDYERTYQAKRIRELLTDLKKSGFKFQGRMREVVAEIMKMSPAQVGRMETIDKFLSAEFKEEYKAGRIGVTAAYELSRLSKERQAQEWAEYQKTGTIEITDIQAQRERDKPQPVPPAEKPMQTAEQATPEAPAPPSTPAASSESVKQPVSGTTPEAEKPAPPSVPVTHRQAVENAHSEIALATCPHCGGAPASLMLHLTGPMPASHVVVCSDCGARTKEYATADEAWEAWNRRPTTESKAQTCEGCKYSYRDGTHGDIDSYCQYCARMPYTDRYEPIKKEENGK